VVGADNCNFN
nr:RecName: Full=Thrombin-like enzyme D-V; Short=SVTLE D-V; AltName: Full=Clotting factor; AltName: Full=Fibrinogen-clotting enzyme; AltName: Full=Snake venom serine protease; Short=SVSP [Bothrops jararacussu]